MIPIGGFEVLIVPATALLAAWFVGYRIARWVNPLLPGQSRSIPDLGWAVWIGYGIVATVLCFVGLIPVGAALEAVREWLGIPGFGIGAATFLGPPPWWIATQCVVAAFVQIVIATATWLLAFNPLASKRNP